MTEEPTMSFLRFVVTLMVWAVIVSSAMTAYVIGRGAHFWLFATVLGFILGSLIGTVHAIVVAILMRRGTRRSR
jgi:hypothetical protein